MVLETTNHPKDMKVRFKHYVNNSNIVIGVMTITKIYIFVIVIRKNGE